MKELYEGLELEVVRFGGEDVITASAEEAGCAEDAAEECAEDIESIIGCRKDAGEDCEPDCDSMSGDNCSIVSGGCSGDCGDLDGGCPPTSDS